MSFLYPWLTSTYDKIVQSFRHHLAYQALLIRADNGLGVTHLCEALIQRLMCQSPLGDHACGACHSCRLIQAKSHPDFHFIRPIENKDIGVDQIRAIMEQANQHAQQSGNKLIYIEQAHRLTEAAANALLKTLEEPRQYTYFLLQADRQTTLLPTIYSRCQVWNIFPPHQDLALNWLRQALSESSSSAVSEPTLEDFETALRVNHFYPLLALNMLQQGLLTQRRDFLRQFWLFYRRRSPLTLYPNFATEKGLVLQQLDWLIAFLMDALKSKLHINSGWICQDIAQGVIQFSQALSISALLNAIDIMQNVRSDLVEINGVNQELILLSGLTRLITDVFEG